MTERAPSRRPGPAPVVWSSIALFAVLFAVLTSQLAASTPAPKRPILLRQVVQRRIVTTVVPTPGRSTITTSGPALPEASPEYAPVATASS